MRLKVATLAQDEMTCGYVFVDESGVAIRTHVNLLWCGLPARLAQIKMFVALGNALVAGGVVIENWDEKKKEILQ